MKALKKKHYKMSKLQEVLDLIINNDKETLINVHNDHQLQGDLKHFKELHIESDWLLIYKVDNKKTNTLIGGNW